MGASALVQWAPSCYCRRDFSHSPPQDCRSTESRCTVFQAPNPRTCHRSQLYHPYESMARMADDGDGLWTGWGEGKSGIGCEAATAWWFHRVQGWERCHLARQRLPWSTETFWRIFAVLLEADNVKLYPAKVLLGPLVRLRFHLWEFCAHKQPSNLLRGACTQFL